MKYSTAFRNCCLSLSILFMLALCDSGDFAIAAPNEYTTPKDSDGYVERLIGFCRAHRESIFDLTDSDGVKFAAAEDICTVFLNRQVSGAAICENRNFETCLKESVENYFRISLGRDDYAGPPCKVGNECTLYFSLYDPEGNYLNNKPDCGFEVGGIAKMSAQGGIVYAPSVSLKWACLGEM